MGLHDPLDGQRSQMGRDIGLIDAEPLVHERPTLGLRRSETRAAESRVEVALAIGFVVLGVGVLGVATAVSLSGTSMHGAGSPPVSDAARPGPVALTDLPDPATNPAALAAYRDGMQALRRGDLPVVTVALKHAVELDPRLAPAYLRLGPGLLLYYPTIARAYFRKATELKSTLTERDQALFDAFTPFVTKEPPDLSESRARLSALAVHYPQDAEISLELGSMDRRLFHCDDAIREYDRALALDPDYSFAAMGKSVCYLLKGDLNASIAASKECERSAPGVSTCIASRLVAEQAGGRCSELQEDARKMIVASPDDQEGYLVGAAALYALGSPISAVRESISQARVRMGPPLTWPRQTSFLELNLEVLQGHFLEAEKLAIAREGDPAVTSSSDGGLHALSAWARIEIAIETGRLDKAADIASDYLARSQAWSPPLHVPSEPQFEYRIIMMSLLERMKRLTSADVQRERETRIETAGTNADPLARGYVWFEAYARPASTPEEAKAALAAIPQYEPLPRVWEFPADAAIGEVYRLAGRLDEAVVHLKSAASECNALNYPFDNTRAHFALGQALEATKDVPGACAAYAVVFSRWGKAQPRSVTAGKAGARMRSLSCN